VVGTATSWVHKTTGNTRNKERIVDLKLDRVLEGTVAFAQHGVKSLGLRDGAWESVEDEPTAGRGVSGAFLTKHSRDRNLPAPALGIVVQLFLDHANDDVIADKAALVHNLLGFPAQRRLLGDLGSQHVTSGLSVKSVSDVEHDQSG